MSYFGEASRDQNIQDFRGILEDSQNSEHKAQFPGGRYEKSYRGEGKHKNAKFGEKEGHKRGHKTKGYHNTFHKDEEHIIRKLYTP